MKMVWVKVMLIAAMVFLVGTGLSCFVCLGWPVMQARIVVAVLTGLVIIIGTIAIIAEDA